jgi:hypothetical protein
MKLETPYARSQFAETLRSGVLPGASPRARNVVTALRAKLDVVERDLATGERSRGEARRAARDELAAALRALAAHVADLRARRSIFDAAAGRVERGVRGKLAALTPLEIARANRVADQVASGARQLDVADAAERGDVESLAAAHLAGLPNVLLAVATTEPAMMGDLRLLASAGAAFADEQAASAAIAELERVAARDDEPWAAANPTRAAKSALDVANGARLSAVLGTQPPEPPAWPAWLRTVVEFDRAPAQQPQPETGTTTEPQPQGAA